MNEEGNGTVTDIKDLIEKYDALTDTIKRDEKEIEESKRELAEVEKSISNLLDGMGAINFSTENGTYYKAQDFFASVKKENIENLHDWLKNEMEAGDLIKSSVHHKTFSGFIKEIVQKNVLDGMEEKAGLPVFISIHKVPRIRFRKRKGS